MPPPSVPTTLCYEATLVVDVLQFSDALNPSQKEHRVVEMVKNPMKSAIA
jgi:hypothetical protein